MTAIISNVVLVSQSERVCARIAYTEIYYGCLAANQGAWNPAHAFVCIKYYTLFYSQNIPFAAPYFLHLPLSFSRTRCAAVDAKYTHTHFQPPSSA
jgi:hypothetical protein